MRSLRGRAWWAALDDVPAGWIEKNRGSMQGQNLTSWKAIQFVQDGCFAGLFAHVFTP
jgi:hypothetical protein